MSPLQMQPYVMEEGMERIPAMRFLSIAMGKYMVWIWFGWLGDDPLVMVGSYCFVFHLCICTAMRTNDGLMIGFAVA